jgi:ubiquinone/menaquinone biosynthesis C-methylase UbiE
MIRRLIQRLKHRSHFALDSRDAYAKWAEHYPPTPHNLLMEIEQDAMLSLIPSVKDKRVLDLASGTGRYGLIAQSQSAEIVICVDDSFAMITRSSLSLALVGSMAQIPLVDDSMDVVLCGLAVGHYANLEVIFSEIARILKVGGQAVISDFHPFQYLSGARRTFMVDETEYEVEHYPHLYQTLFDASESSGLLIEAIREPSIEGQMMPVVIVYRLMKVT